jgi:hypothetical protein
MSAVQPLCRLIGVTPDELSKEENLLLEAELLTQLCRQLKEIFRKQNNSYFRLMKFTTEMENRMLDENFLRLVINDILSTDEYNIKGIAFYTDTHEDILQEIVTGQIQRPTAYLERRIIELHKFVRHDLYQSLMKKILTQYQTAIC